MNAKKRKQLLTLLVLLAVAIVVWIAVILINQAETQKEEDSIIYVETVDDPTGLTLTIEEGSYSFSAEATTETDGDADEDEDTDEDEDETVWSLADDADFPVQSDSINEITEALAELTASREISIEDDLDAYGLEDPAASITVTNDAGDSATLLLGSETSSGYYYCMLEDSDVIYVIESTLYSLLPGSLTELAELTEYPAFSSDILDSITISGDYEETFEVREVEVEEESDDEDSSEVTITTEYHYFLSGETDVTGESLITSLRTEVFSIEMTSLAIYKPTEDELSEYGIDDPTAVLTVEYEDDDETLTSELIIGSYDEDEDVYYCILDGDTNMLYAVDASSLENVITIAEQGYEAASAAAEEDDE